MKKPNNILYVINDAEIDEASLKLATDYAKNANAHLNFLRIYESYKSMSTFFHIPSVKLAKTLLNNLEASIEKFNSHVSGLNFSCHVREGIWFIEAIQEGLRTKSNLTIISEPTTHQAFFASNAMHLIRKSAAPIWLIRKNILSGYKKILVTVDIDMNDKVKKDVNAKVMMLAKQLKDASSTPVELIVVHCWSLANEKYLREIASNITASQIDEMSNREKIFHEEWFDAFCKKHPETINDAYFMKGEAEEIIPEFVNNEKIDILTMGTVNNIIASGFYISSRSETILNAIPNCSVLTVKPTGFVSPVQ